MTAYLMLMGDRAGCGPEQYQDLADTLLAAGERHLLGRGRLNGVAHSPHSADSMPIELSPDDHATQSWLSIPETLSFIDIDNGWAAIHAHGKPFSDQFKAYFQDFCDFYRQRAPDRLVGYVLWWDGICDDLPALSIRRFDSVTDLLATTPELRVIGLAPVSSP